MRFVLIDDATAAKAAIYTREFDSAEEAIHAAETEWAHMSDHDKARRDAFYVLQSVNPDEDAEDHMDGIPVKIWK